jgi:hypothetical protein
MFRPSNVEPGFTIHNEGFSARISVHTSQGSKIRPCDETLQVQLTSDARKSVAEFNFMHRPYSYSKKLN